MQLRRPGPALVAFAACAVALLWPAAAGGADDKVQVVSNVTYDVMTAGTPVHVGWDVVMTNNDPATTNTGAGTVSFYDTLQLPVLRGAGNVRARSAAGAPLAVSIDPAGQGPVQRVTVTLDRKLFYHDTYGFSLTYDLAEVRTQSLLVTPSYVFLPVIAGGSEATVTVHTPADSGWSVSLEPGECPQNGAVFNCAGSASTYLAATLEVTRPDAISRAAFDVPLGDRTLSVTVSYFQGEADFAPHLQQLLAAALPVIQELYGFPLGGPSVFNISQGGRQSVLGYEGLTTCTPGASCDIVVSPIADDYTLMHELSHLWSGVYARRWLAEGFAQLITERAASQLPTGLLRGQPPQRPASTVNLQLDDWGDVATIVGASAAELAAQDAGYDRSLRFLDLLRFQLGMAALQNANKAIAGSGEPADSRRYLDAVEDASGRRADDLFALWVFPPSYSSVLRDRRLARDRLAAAAARMRDEGLPSDALDKIRQDVQAWNFQQALAELGQVDESLATYADLKQEVFQLRADAGAAGLTLPDTIDGPLRRWEFDRVRQTLGSVREAVDAYGRARTRTAAGRNLWERFGLLGSDPDGDRQDAAAAFAAGDFQTAVDKSQSAIDALDNAAAVALRRMLILAGLLAAFALVIGVAVWASRLRERGLAGP